MEMVDFQEIRDYAEHEYARWKLNTAGDTEMQEELQKIEGNEEEIFDAFYTSIRFGTSGLRGILGPGTNRINSYVIRRATQGLSNYMKKNFKNPSCVISYDSRKYSKTFALESARVFTANGIHTYIFRELTPVPVLSYAIRELGCDIGVMITASHNPKIYNGYKIFNRDGYQIVGEDPEKILSEIDALDYFGDDIKTESKQEAELVPNDLRDRFIYTMRDSMPASDLKTMNQLKTIYTPLHGTGYKFVKAAFKANGYTNYDIVSIQENPDPNFPTCPVPNPEKIIAFDEGFRLLDQEQGDIIIATDPDSDRVGCALYHDGMRTLITGNQLGILMLDYLCHFLPPKPSQFVFKSITTTPLVNKMAMKYGFRVVNTLTGFKYIGQLLTALEDAGRKDDFYFGFEESNSFLVRPFIHEKDGISGALMIVKMAAFHKSQGKDMIDRLNEIYDEFGICKDKQRNYLFTGAEGKEKMEEIMNFLRNMPAKNFGEHRISALTDYEKDNTGLPKSNALKFEFDDGSSMVIRPSGTESKIKIYSFETEDFRDVERAIVKIIEKFQ